MNELKNIIQEAWNAGDNQGKPAADTFGAFLDRAAEAIETAGYRKVEPVSCPVCGGKMSPNPHPMAGKPSHYLEVGTAWECIPCLVFSRHRWAVRAMEYEDELYHVRNHGN